MLLRAKWADVPTRGTAAPLVGAIDGLPAAMIALASGTWTALALRGMTGTPKLMLDFMLFAPGTALAVSIGLGLLVAFIQLPVPLNGATPIVFLAHFLLVPGAGPLRGRSRISTKAAV